MVVDTLRRFMLERAHVRGEWVHLDNTWQELLARTDYPDFVKQVLGQALTAAVLLSATLKHKGSLILQIRGDGPIHLLVVQATGDGSVRGLAKWTKDVEGNDLASLFGVGQMAITFESPVMSERYQSLIPLEGNSLAQALENYFIRSEQLPTRLWLASDNNVAAGILLQRLPTEQNATEEDWQRTSLLLDTLTAQELLYLEPENTLYRLFHEEEVRLFDGQPIRFHCNCGRARVETMLRSMGQEEVNSLIQEQGKITVTCEFCNATYALDAVDAGKLFKSSMPSNNTLH